MSLEEAMLKQAEASNKLADAFNRYADVVERFGLKLENDNAGKATVAQQEADKPAKAEKPAGKPGRPPNKATKPAPEPEPESDGLDDDDNELGDEEEIVAPKNLGHDDVKKKLLEVKAANGGDKAPAIAIITSFGYDTIQQVKEKHFADIWVEAEKKLRELNG